MLFSCSVEGVECVTLQQGVRGEDNLNRHQCKTILQSCFTFVHFSHILFLLGESGSPTAVKRGLKTTAAA